MSGFQSLNWALVSTELLKPDPCEQYRLTLIAGRVEWDGFQIAVRNLYKKGTGTREKQSHLTSCKEKYWSRRALILLFLFPSILCSTDFDYNNLHVCLSPCYLLKLLVGWGDLSRAATCMFLKIMKMILILISLLCCLKVDLEGKPLELLTVLHLPA